MVKLQPSCGSNMHCMMDLVLEAHPAFSSFVIKVLDSFQDFFNKKTTYLLKRSFSVDDMDEVRPLERGFSSTKKNLITSMPSVVSRKFACNSLTSFSRKLSPQLLFFMPLN